MKLLLRLLVVLAALAGIFILASLLLPSYHKVARSAVVNASIPEVYDQLINFDNWSHWNLWDQRDGPANTASSAPAQGVGAWHEWKDKANGHVKALLTYQEGRRSLYYRLLFYDHGVVAIGSFHLEPAGDGTNVVWTVVERVGINPLKRWFSLFFSLRAGPELGRALENLKNACEASAGSK